MYVLDMWNTSLQAQNVNDNIGVICTLITHSLFGLCTWTYKDGSPVSILLIDGCVALDTCWYPLVQYRMIFAYVALLLTHLCFSSGSYTF